MKVYLDKMYKFSTLWIMLHLYILEIMSSIY